MNYRTQRSRTRVPGIEPGSVYIGRPSQWGNPATVGQYYKPVDGEPVLVSNRYLAVDLFYRHIKHLAQTDVDAFILWVKPLIGKNVCCWCPVGEVCHGDIILYIADRMRTLLEKTEFRTLIFEDVKDWPDLSGIIVI